MAGLRSGLTDGEAGAGLPTRTLAIAIGEPMQNSAWLAVGEAGTVVRTAQTRIKLNASVTLGNSNLGGGINLLAVNLPLNVEVAYAEAKLTDIHGKTHYLLIEPEEGEMVMPEGSEVVIIRQQGPVYRAISKLKPAS